MGFGRIDIQLLSLIAAFVACSPEELYHIAALLRDTERLMVEGTYSRETGERTVAVCTARLHNIPGTYTGKNDPIMLVRIQGSLPATGEAPAPFHIGRYVAGFVRGIISTDCRDNRNGGTVISSRVQLNRAEDRFRSRPRY